MVRDGQYCCFTLDGLLFGLPAGDVQEVLRAVPMTPVPLAPPEVQGLVNLRGQIVTAIDLRKRLGLPDRPAGTQPMNLVVRDGQGAVSLLVDDIGDVMDLDAVSFEPPPETLRGEARDLIRGAFKLERRLLLLLDGERVVALGT